MASEKPKVKASVETMAYYNMVLPGAIFQLLEGKGLLKRQEVKDRIEKIKDRDRDEAELSDDSVSPVW